MLVFRKFWGFRDLVFRVQGLAFRVSGSGLSGLRALGLRLRI